MSKKKSSAPKIEIYDYLASVLYGICHGPIDAIYRVRIAETNIFIGTRTADGVQLISDRELFGGPREQGGVEGHIEYKMGAWDQPRSQNFAALIKKSMKETPAFRGIATILFRGAASSTISSDISPGMPPWITDTDPYRLVVRDPGIQGFYWHSNNTFLPTVDVTLFDAAIGPNPAYATIWPFDQQEHDPEVEEGASLRNLPGANPAYIIYEALTSQDFGAQVPPEGMDDPAFEAAAQRLHADKFGLSLIWEGQGQIKTLIQQVVDHVRCFVFIDPDNGLWTIRLMRADLTYNTPRTLDPSNCNLRNRKRMAWSETVNEVVVSYTDLDADESATVTSVNLGNVAMQNGRVNSEKREYPGITNAELAQKVADRDVAELSYPLWTAQVVADRSFWNVKPGDVHNLTWPEDGIETMRVRVMDVEQGGPDQAEVKFTITEDIFSVEQTAFRAPQTSLFDPDNLPPDPFAVSMPVTLPHPILLRASGLSTSLLDEAWPSVPVGFVLNTPGVAMPEGRVNGPVVQPDGSPALSFLTRTRTRRTATVPFPFVPQVTTVVSGSYVSGLLPDAAVGDILMLGQSDEDSELVMLYTYAAGPNQWTLLRGLYDTEPGEWPAGTRVSVFPNTLLGTDPESRIADEEITYFFQSIRNGRTLPLAAAPPVPFTPRDRPILPFRPANCQLDGQGFNGVDYSLSMTPPATITATWANRNRTREDSIPTLWNGATVTRETGQTTTLRVRNLADQFVNEVVGLVGTSYDLTGADLGNLSQGYVEFIAVRDGFESRVKPRRNFIRSPVGYGTNYGESYGG